MFVEGFVVFNLLLEAKLLVGHLWLAHLVRCRIFDLTQVLLVGNVVFVGGVYLLIGVGLSGSSSLVVLLLLLVIVVTLIRSGILLIVLIVMLLIG